MTIDTFSLSPSGWVSFALVASVELAVALCPPVLFATYTPAGVKQVAKLYGPLGIEPTQANLGRGLQFTLLTLLLLVPHLLEVRWNLQPLLHRYNVNSPAVRWTWVSSGLFPQPLSRSSRASSLVVDGRS